MTERIEVLAIGDELLDGRVVDTNTSRLAVALQPLGAELAQRTTVRDDLDAIVLAVRAVIARGATLCFVSGGLGPTTDDLTAEAFARAAAAPLVCDEATRASIAAFFTRRGREPTPNNLRQAMRPRGAALISNPVGTAPGFSLVIDGCDFVVLPGVPIEYDAMLPDVLASRFADGSPLLRRVLMCIGLGESEIDARLMPLSKSSPDVHVGYRVPFPETHVLLTARRAHEAALDAAEVFVRQVLGEDIFGAGSQTLPEAVITRLREKRCTLALAESCSGGALSDMVTDVPGASEVFLGSVVAYANAAKEELLAVPAEELEELGAVSERVVARMAEGARARFGATHALATSGVAGPGGGTLAKPVGTVWLALASERETMCRKLELPFDRRRNKVASAAFALDWLRRALGAG